MRMLTIHDVNEETGIPVDTIYFHIKQGTLSVNRIGGSDDHTGMYLVTQQDCDRYKAWAAKHYKAKSVNRENEKNKKSKNWSDKNV